MKINYFFLLVTSLLFALVFTFSCSSPGGGGGGGGGGSLYKGCKVNGTDYCTPLPASNAEATCQNLGGVIDKTCTFVNCKINGTCSPVQDADICELSGGQVVSDKECKNGGDSPPSSNGQYCYVASAGCALIGTKSSCNVYSTAECQNTYGGSIKTLDWCKSNVGTSKIYGCDGSDPPPEPEGYCLFSGASTCFITTQSNCNFLGGTFNKNSCPSAPPSSSQYCYYYYEDYEVYYCDLIGTDPHCYVSSTAECQNELGGSIKTHEWCKSNVGTMYTYECEDY